MALGRWYRYEQAGFPHFVLALLRIQTSVRGWLAREQVRKARALRRAYIRGRTLAGELVAARPGDPLGLIEQNREEYLETVEEMQFWKMVETSCVTLQQWWRSMRLWRQYVRRREAVRGVKRQEANMRDRIVFLATRAWLFLLDINMLEMEEHSVRSAVRVAYHQQLQTLAAQQAAGKRLLEIADELVEVVAREAEDRHFLASYEGGQRAEAMAMYVAETAWAWEHDAEAVEKALQQMPLTEKLQRRDVLRSQQTAWAQLVQEFARTSFVVYEAAEAQRREEILAEHAAEEASLQAARRKHRALAMNVSWRDRQQWQRLEALAVAESEARAALEVVQAVAVGALREGHAAGRRRVAAAEERRALLSDEVAARAAAAAAEAEARGQLTTRAFANAVEARQRTCERQVLQMEGGEQRARAFILRAEQSCRIDVLATVWANKQSYERWLLGTYEDDARLQLAEQQERAWQATVHRFYASNAGLLLDTLQRLEAAHRGRALEAEAATRSELGAERWADQRWLARHGGLLMRVQLTRLRPAIAGWARRGRQRASVSFAAFLFRDEGLARAELVAEERRLLLTIDAAMLPAAERLRREAVEDAEDAEWRMLGHLESFGHVEAEEDAYFHAETRDRTAEWLRLHRELRRALQAEYHALWREHLRSKVWRQAEEAEECLMLMQEDWGAGRLLQVEYAEQRQRGLLAMDNLLCRRELKAVEIRQRVTVMVRLYPRRRSVDGCPVSVHSKEGAPTPLRRTTSLGDFGGEERRQDVVGGTLERSLLRLRRHRLFVHDIEFSHEQEFRRYKQLLQERMLRPGAWRPSVLLVNSLNRLPFSAVLQALNEPPPAPTPPAGQSGPVSPAGKGKDPRPRPTPSDASAPASPAAGARAGPYSIPSPSPSPSASAGPGGCAKPPVRGAAKHGYGSRVGSKAPLAALERGAPPPPPPLPSPYRPATLCLRGHGHSPLAKRWEGGEEGRLSFPSHYNYADAPRAAPPLSPTQLPPID
eukprot:EG_transcript_1938